MTTQKFNPVDLKKLYKPPVDSSKGQNGQVTIIGGSSLFHGAPLLALKTASRIVDMVFFASPEKSVGESAIKIKSQLSSFIWIPWNDLDEYIEKSDAVLIGSGFMRNDETRSITKMLLTKYSNKRWVIDAGSLQMIEASLIPKGSILTPNQKEYKMLFGDINIRDAAKKFDCTIVLKGPETIVASPENFIRVVGGNAGLTKGGTGDVQAGLTAALFAKNDAFLAAAAASYVVKKSADVLYKKFGTYYNSDDLVNKIPEVLAKMV